MKWTIRQAYGINSFNVNTTKDMMQALKMLADVNDDSIYAETTDCDNVVQYVSVKDWNISEDGWNPFYIVRHYGWKGIDYDMLGIAHIDAKTGGKIDCKGNMIPNIVYEIQKAIHKG